MKTFIKIFILVLLSSNIWAVSDDKEILIHTPKSITVSPKDKEDLLKLIHKTSNKKIESIQITNIGHPRDSWGAIVDFKPANIGDNIFEFDILQIRNDDWLNKYEKQMLKTDKTKYEKYLTKRKVKYNEVYGKWWVYVYYSILKARYNLGDFSVYIAYREGLNYNKAYKLLTDIDNGNFIISLDKKSLKWQEGKKIDLTCVDFLEKKHDVVNGKDVYYWYLAATIPKERVREEYFFEYINNKLTLTDYTWNHY
ncbi:MAG: hypothetical protein P9M03_01340 [Candidatus Theseobacter exili]|nr:hypothetical protein [Candidatus Theseobacter exili]